MGIVFAQASMAATRNENQSAAALRLFWLVAALGEVLIQQMLPWRNTERKRHAGIPHCLLRKQWQLLSTGWKPTAVDQSTAVPDG
mmetsp:Transcript_33542/g.79596  ORF Transcript_33542/g.79596 Transcript_33542/m.79596 type:complete len:85 (+) Transcript_33542:219-473(+)